MWTQAVAVSPNSPFALNNLGASYYVRGDIAGAKKIFEQSFSVNPTNPTSLYNLAIIAEKTGNYAEASMYYKLFLERAGVSQKERIDIAKKFLRSYEIIYGGQKTKGK